MTALRPPMPYFGGKIMLAPKIVELFPPHLHYVEPFAGSLSVLAAKPPSAMETVNDLDGLLVGFWRTLRERPEDLIRACAATPHSRAEYDHAVAAVETEPDDLERARLVWIRLTQGRTGRLVRTGWRHFVDPSNSGIGMPRYLDAYVARMSPLVERLRNVTLECRPALEIIDRYGTSADVLLYVDPPYLGSTRGNDNAYRHEMRSDDEHRDLASRLRAAKASIVISGYASALYDIELYPDWYRVTFAAGTGQGGVWANRTEVLWSNRPIGERHLFSEVPA